MNTLKDIAMCPIDYGDQYSLVTPKEAGVEPLKKDNVVEIGTLRAEAIKWIKHLEKVMFCPKCQTKNTFPEDGKLVCCECETVWDYNSEGNKIGWIKHFFNITDSELSKEG